MVIIGSARHDENGGINGKFGDQTTEEVSTQEYYNHSKGWRVFRSPSTSAAVLIAEAMQVACDNNHFGYGQNQRVSGFEAAKLVGYDPANVVVDCNIDCSELVRLCLHYAGYRCSDFDTSGEAGILKGLGFTEIKITNPSELRPGDVLVTKTKGHTVVVISNDAIKNLKNCWLSTPAGWQFFNESGDISKSTWILWNKRWYYIGKDGIMLTGVQVINGKKYYLQEDGPYIGACNKTDIDGALDIWEVNV